MTAKRANQLTLAVESSPINADPDRASTVSQVKEHGVHYTPVELSNFVARRLLAHLETDACASILDPAAGDGELLSAVASAAEGGATNLSLVGVDRDELAIARGRARLAESMPGKAELLVGDFLQRVDGLDDRLFDAVISNPPYVRTQVLGAATARELAARFDLKGRVDLYQAFVTAMTRQLRPGGVLALICSNRFLTVQAGTALRELFSSEYELCEVYDLGDTKLFKAAVLPAVVIARRVNSGAKGPCRFVSVYERTDTVTDAVAHPSIVAALNAETDGVVSVDDRLYEIEEGELRRGVSSDEPWRVNHVARERWLTTVAAHTDQTFGDVAAIRVGIKTTADSVFIRRSWDELPIEERPELQLIRPLITHHIARRWSAANDTLAARSVLYPHVETNGKRIAVDLESFPRAASYLESHRERLEGRSYVTDAGRQWFEIWVPQQPGDWAKRKIVFPDIAESPQFFLDTSGAVVNGDCYWMALEDSAPPQLASLLLAVANSSLALEFYDAVCGNRLYAGRRRFITQYVKRFPLPQVSAGEREDIHERVEALRALQPSDAQRVELEANLNSLVWRAFGLREEVSR